MGQVWSLIFPPPPALTEDNLPDQTGKVFIVTGASSGIGLALVSILYKHNAKVYLAARSRDKARKAIENVKHGCPGSSGQITFLHLDLGDLATIRKSVNDFLSKESRLDVLWNNAGVMVPPQGSKTAQGYELQLGTNNIGHHLFTKLLHPLLSQTAKSSHPGSVRVVWVSSSAALRAPIPAIDFTNMDYHREEPAWRKYARSKAGNVLQACEFSKRTKEEGIISVSLHPGLLMTDLQRSLPAWQVGLFGWVAHEPKFGAYTELYAGLHEDIAEQSGAWILPWGRLAVPREDLQNPALAEQYRDWMEEQIKPYN